MPLDFGPGETLADLLEALTPEYSPPPWTHDRVAVGGHDVEAVYDANRRLVLMTPRPADARLAAHAPELLAAARRLVDAVQAGRDDITDELTDLAEACVAADGVCR